MKKILETERVYLRQFISGDTPDIFQLNKNIEVLKFTGDSPCSSSLEIEEFISHYFKNVYHHPTSGEPTDLGRLAVMRKTDHVFLGWCGLSYNKDHKAVDINFRFHEFFWNQGFATESATAVIEYAFSHLRLPQLIAYSHVDNKASETVLKKCGFTLEKESINNAQPCYLYSLQNSSYTIREISADETHSVRHAVLRVNRPIEDVYMESDEKENTFHLGVFYNSDIIGVASFMEDVYPDYHGEQSRLRGMAVLPAFRNKGIARSLLQKGEEILREKGRTLLWFNARINAVDFYKNQGYELASQEFDIPQIGAHYRMKKEL